MSEHQLPGIWGETPVTRTGGLSYVRYKGDAYKGDERALRTGEYSDCQVTCEDRTWNLHRLILFRSPFLWKAFTSNQSEGSHKVLHGFSKSEFDVAITYLYLEDYPESLKANPSITFCYRIFAIAVHLEIVGLDFIAIEALSQALAKLEGSILDAALALKEPENKVNPSSSLSTLLSEHVITEIEKLAKAAFDSPKPSYRALQKPVSDFVAKTSCLLGTDLNLSATIQADPRLWAKHARMITKEESAREATEEGISDTGDRDEAV
ncbi:hypothetical protein PG984_015460 [Apiospora sp. TS-2023a]